MAVLRVPGARARGVHPEGPARRLFGRPRLTDRHELMVAVDDVDPTVLVDPLPDGVPLIGLLVVGDLGDSAYPISPRRDLDAGSRSKSVKSRKISILSRIRE